MAEELQHLIDRIHKDAVGKAEAEANKLLADAKAKAEQLVKAAQAQAQALLEKADKDAEVFAIRSAKTMEQSARDVLISVGQGVEKIVLGILSNHVEKGLASDVIPQMLLSLAQGYAGKSATVVLSPADAAKLTSFITGEFQKTLGAGVTVESDSSLFAGFRLTLDNGKVSHEFTSAAIADALSSLLRPNLAKAVQQAAQGK